MPGRDRLPDTLKRSPPKAQRTWAKAHDNAVREYGEGGRAHRVAYAALKHSFEKQGDHWVAKERAGPSDSRAESSGKAAREGRGESFGGLDYNGSSRSELYQRARSLGIEGRSKMNKKELARAIAHRQ